MNTIYSRLLIIIMLGVLAGKANAAADTTINLSVDAGKITGQVSKNIYGDLLEHIYHSVNGGLWGEMLASRSFEPQGSKGWYLKNDEIISAGTRTSSLMVGTPTWADYEITGSVMWEPYFVGVPAPWSGGQSDIRFMVRNNTGAGAYAFHLDADKEQPFSLEKVSSLNKGLKTTVLKSAASSAAALVQSRKWHGFRIQCKGNRITVFMDDIKVLDHTDTQAPLLSGNVGLLLTKTSARFKNIQVKSLQGATLWQGLPDEVKPQQVAPDWAFYGKGNFTLSKGNTVNGDYAQNIAVVNKEAGVKQPIYQLTAGQAYHGTVWLRGDKGLKLFVRLQNGTGVLAQAQLPAAGKLWKKYHFKLVSSASAPQAQFIIGTKGTGSLWIDQASLFPESAEKNDGFRPDLYQALAGLQPAHLRWPGGSYASGYNWRWGIGPQENRVRLVKPSWDDLEQNAFGTDEFLRLCKKLGSEPVIVIRIGYDRPDNERPQLIKEARQWLEYCNGSAGTEFGKLRAKNGHPQPYGVKYWEIDNEMWELGAEKYAAILREFVPALKKIDPSIKIIACGDFTEQGKSRDSVLLNSSAAYFDYISLHHYESPSRYLEGPLKMAEKYKEEERWIARSPNPAVKLYISEWNAAETDWRTGLYAGGLLNVFEKDPHVDMAAAALLLRRTDATGWNNAFINFDGNGWFAAPNYVVTKLYREHFQPTLIALSGNDAKLNAVATRSADSKTVVIKIVNAADKPVTVNLKVSNFRISTKPRLFLIAPGSLKAANTMTKPDLVSPIESELENTGNNVSLVLPALSVAVTELRN